MLKFHLENRIFGHSTNIYTSVWNMNVIYWNSSRFESKVVLGRRASSLKMTHDQQLERNVVNSNSCIPSKQKIEFDPFSVVETDEGRLWSQHNDAVCVSSSTMHFFFNRTSVFYLRNCNLFHFRNGPWIMLGTTISNSNFIFQIISY